MPLSPRPLRVSTSREEPVAVGVAAEEAGAADAGVAAAAAAKEGTRGSVGAREEGIPRRRQPASLGAVEPLPRQRHRPRLNPVDGSGRGLPRRDPGLYAISMHFGSGRACYRQRHSAVVRCFEPFSQSLGARSRYRGSPSQSSPRVGSNC